MGNLEQISTSVYPSKNYSKYPKSTLEHKWFLSKMLFCHSSVLRNLRFLNIETAILVKSVWISIFWFYPCFNCFYPNNTWEMRISARGLQPSIARQVFGERLTESRCLKTQNHMHSKGNISQNVSLLGGNKGTKNIDTLTSFCFRRWKGLR